MRLLVVYYSLDGNTRFIAGQIAEATGADLLELKTLVGPPEGFKKYFWGGRQVMTREKPVLAAFEKDPAVYDLIFIGTPVWAFSFAPALRTFFFQTLLRGKKVALFCCSGGGPGRTLSHMEESLGNNTIVSRIAFVEPLRAREKNAALARAWAKDAARVV